MDANTTATNLLLLRIISVTFLGLVLRKQWKYIRENNPKEEQKVRIVLFFLTTLAFLGNFIPITIDIITIYKDLHGVRIDPLLGSYAYSNAATSAIAAVGWFLLYRIAERERVYMRKRNKELNEEVDQLHDEANE